MSGIRLIASLLFFEEFLPVFPLLRVSAINRISATD